MPIFPLYRLGQRAIFNVVGIVGEAVVIARADNEAEGFYYTLRLATGGEVGAKESDIEMVSYLLD